MNELLSTETLARPTNVFAESFAGLPALAEPHIRKTRKAADTPQERSAFLAELSWER